MSKSPDSDPQEETSSSDEHGGSRRKRRKERQAERNHANSQFEQYEQGQEVTCVVTGTEPGGYAVELVDNQLPGFITTQLALEQGQQVVAHFSGVLNQRARLTLSDIDLINITTGKTPPPPPAVAQRKRATDLVPSAESAILPAQTLHVSASEVADYIQKVEASAFTGCIKSACEDRKSRSALICHRGRVVGCIYGNTILPNPEPTAQSLALMMEDWRQTADAALTTYELPEQIVLPLAALFMGKPQDKLPNLSCEGYFRFVLGSLAADKQTACISVIQSSGAIYHAFVYQGSFAGGFDVADQNYNPEVGVIEDIFDKSSVVEVLACVLPSTGVSELGLNLSDAWRNHLLN